MGFTSDEIQEFKIEAEELLENAELSLLALDKGADFASQYDSIFRAFHSIKGAAGMMEMETMQSHMHRLENTLTEQKGNATLRKPYIDLFLRGIDGCRVLLRDGSINFDYSVHEVDAASSVATSPSATPQATEAVTNVVPIARPESRKTPAPNAKRSLGRLMVVDDEEDLVEMFVDSLSHAGYEVRGFTNPVEALGCVQEYAPDTMVSDISMPEMTGLQLMAKVRELQPDLPVIFVSGFMDKANLMEAIQLGVYSVIEKPFEMNRVITTCRNAVKQHQIIKLLGTSLNLLMYQFSDLDEFLRQQGKEDVRKLIHSEMNALLDQRRELRAISKVAVQAPAKKAK